MSEITCPSCSKTFDDAGGGICPHCGAALRDAKAGARVPMPLPDATVPFACPGAQETLADTARPPGSGAPDPDTDTSLRTGISRVGFAPSG